MPPQALIGLADLLVKQESRKNSMDVGRRQPPFPTQTPRTWAMFPEPEQ